MFNPARAEGLTFEIGGPHKVHLRMRPMHPDSDPFGHRQGIECKITASFVATKFLMDFVGAIIERRFTTYEGMPIKLPHVKDGREEIYADGSFREGYVLPFEGYPLPLRDLCDEAEQLLLDAGTRFLKLIVWSSRYLCAKYLNVRAAVQRGVALAAAGADILDIGGESTRPGSTGVSAEVELRRILPVITALVKKIEIPISVDTSKAVVAEAAIPGGRRNHQRCHWVAERSAYRGGGEASACAVDPDAYARDTCNDAENGIRARCDERCDERG